SQVRGVVGGMHHDPHRANCTTSRWHRLFCGLPVSEFAGQVIAEAPRALPPGPTRLIDYQSRDPDSFSTLLRLLLSLALRLLSFSAETSLETSFNSLS